MSAQQLPLGKPHMYHARSLGRGPFKQAAGSAAQTPPPVAVPVSMPPTKFPCPDNYQVIANGPSTKFVLQREERIFEFNHTLNGVQLALKWVIAPGGKTHSRHMLQDEATYGFKMLQQALEPGDDVTYGKQLKAISSAVTNIAELYKDKSPSLVGRRYTFNKYGQEYSMAIDAPYASRVSFRNVTGINEARDMTAHELAFARVAIARGMSVSEAATRSAFLKGLENRQYGMPAP